jgi:hypothetical protein
VLTSVCKAACIITGRLLLVTHRVGSFSQIRMPRRDRQDCAAIGR